jgi:hypothetical protein
MLCTFALTVALTMPIAPIRWESCPGAGSSTPPYANVGGKNEMCTLHIHIPHSMHCALTAKIAP